MGTHNIWGYKEVEKKYTGCNLKTTELLVCALVAVCAVIRSDMVFTWIHFCAIRHDGQKIQIST